MEIEINSVDYAPADLHAQTPIVAELLRELPGKDRPDYWLAQLRVPITWVVDNRRRLVTHLVLAARWQNTRIEPGIAGLPVAIAYVTDRSLLSDRRLDFGKAVYVAIGLAHDLSVAKSSGEHERILVGRIGTFFSTGTKQGLLRRLVNQLRFWAT
jgi:hypothetical protein